MVSPPQLRRDLGEIENHLRLTRNRLTCYQMMNDNELAEHTSRVVAGLESTRQVLITRLQDCENVKN